MKTNLMPENVSAENVLDAFILTLLDTVPAEKALGITLTASSLIRRMVTEGKTGAEIADERDAAREGKEVVIGG